ncbi:MAG: MGMT family protein, partial [Desulfobacteraceae bacterium]|nr:MGMT family protein [Desulfobacteraceae bacterium]
HRVIRSNGSAGGFGGGSAMKLRLLEYEGVMKHTVLAHRK